MLNGIDIYEEDNIADWDLIKKNYDVVIQKATQGTGHLDRFLNYRYKKIKNVGLKIGFYHFAGTHNAIEEAKFFLSNISGLISDTVVFLDIENTESDNPALRRIWGTQEAIDYANAWINYVRSQGYIVGVYTCESFYNEKLNGNIPQVPLWIASYGKQPSTYPKESWQYSEHGRILGAIGDIDLNYFSENILISGGKKEVDTIVVCNRGADQNTAELLADYLNCPVIMGDRQFDFSNIKNVVAVGGTKEQYTSYLTKIFSGADRYITMQVVLDFIKSNGKLN